MLNRKKKNYTFLFYQYLLAIGQHNLHTHTIYLIQHNTAPYQLLSPQNNLKYTKFIIKFKTNSINLPLNKFLE